MHKERDIQCSDNQLIQEDEYSKSKLFPEWSSKSCNKMNDFKSNSTVIIRLLTIN